MSTTLERPVLTLPEAEAEALAAACRGAECLLEYGSGGSTLLAAERGLTVFSVESDAAWMAGIRSWFAAHPPKGQVHLHHADIGPTGEWGHPLDDSGFRGWPRYALSVWDRPDFRHPDLVLIDGRFRVACLLATALRITKPVVVLFDDYTDRSAYHRVEELLRPTTTIGRMARFELQPMAFPVDRMAWIFNFFLRPL